MPTNVSMQTPIPDYGNFGQVIGNAIGRARQLKESTRQFDIGQLLERQRMEEIEKPTVALRQATLNLEEKKHTDLLKQRKTEFDQTFGLQKNQFGWTKKMDQKKFNQVTDQFNALHQLSGEKFNHEKVKFMQTHALDERQFTEFQSQFTRKLEADQSKWAEQLGFNRDQLNEDARQFNAMDATERERFKKTNAFKHKELAAYVAQFGVTHGLKEREFKQRQTEFGATLGLSRDQFAESKRQFDALQSLRGDELTFAMNKFKANFGLDTAKFGEYVRQYNKDFGLKERRVGMEERQSDILYGPEGHYANQMRQGNILFDRGTAEYEADLAAKGEITRYRGDRATEEEGIAEKRKQYGEAMGWGTPSQVISSGPPGTLGPYIDKGAGKRIESDGWLSYLDPGRYYGSPDVGWGTYASFGKSQFGENVRKGYGADPLDQGVVFSPEADWGASTKYAPELYPGEEKNYLNDAMLNRIYQSQFLNR